MPFRIQRTPRGLSDVLSLFGGQTPSELEDRVRGVIDILQLYGQTQLQSGFAFGSVAENVNVPLVLSASAWTVLFAAQVTVTKTATMTALRGRLSLERGTAFGAALFSDELGPFGATENGNATIGGFLPYPVLCPPGSRLLGAAEIIGTDAVATVSVFGEFGVLG